MAGSFAFLHSDQASLVLECRADGPPLWRHLGARLDPGMLTPLALSRTAASFSLDRDEPVSTAPRAGLGWFGSEALRLRQAGSALIPAFETADVTQSDTAIHIVLNDHQTGIELRQSIELLAGGAFRFTAELVNAASHPVEVDWLASALIPLPPYSAALLSWRGRHNAELVEQVEPMPQQAWLREGRRGISGHGGPPGVVVLGEGAGHHSGLVHALQLAWSGDSSIAVERDDEGFWILNAGARFDPGEIVLGPGERIATPAAILAVSTAGRNGALAQHHAAIRAAVDWPGGTMRRRPVHLNSWEACYFDHDETRIGALAEAAAAIGVERFILDDGWFRGRNNDDAGLGDWTADPVKYPAGLTPLAQRVRAMGMEFGLWVEPEMVNPDSDLYRAHPDWALHLPGRDQPTARNQLVLNLALPEVQEYLFGALDALLREVPISYLKWDHNRDLAPAGGAAQVLGTYRLLARLRAAHPSVEIEGCAGGGGRSDAGLVPFVHRFWTSDNIDAVSRVRVQRGFLSFLAPELMGAHIGASPAHATGRSQSLGFRAAVAMPGHFGVELDPRQLDEADRIELAGWIAFHKQWRHLLHGTMTWLGEGADGLVWQAAGTAAEFLLFAIRTAPALDRRPQPLCLPFLAKSGSCTIELLRIAGAEGGHAAHLPALFDAPVPFTGSWLANSGLPLPPLKSESVAIFHGTVAP
ncbi:alpha-galactosidase [Novosphingobium sp. B 225]|uniref:alpha-galactosidase n=1 Tax=Novosphingobium sp. B 225 TaxID=1961849 RepID=UPI000B4B0DB4|nr:alpha-galactosidase [Novosphingobium sp. B 225]